MKQTFLVSDETVNTYGFRILTAGIDTTRFEKNPIMLYMHEQPIIIGRWENLTKKGGQLFADAVFDEADPIAKEIMGKVERGFLKATSLGIFFEPSSRLKDEKGDYIEKCELIEISIVAIPSNSNAVKLYNDSFETVQLKLNQLSEINSIANLFQLPNSASQKEVLTLVTNLKAENTTYKNQLLRVEQEQEKELKAIIELAEKRGFLKPVLSAHFLELGKKDFFKTKDELIKLFPIQTQSFMEQIETHKQKGVKLDGKDKSQWNLEDYRKFAPKELQENPELFQKLLAEYTAQ
jgi:HK97 family phage prohead protease